MKKFTNSLKVLILVTTLSVCFTSCKKGENKTEVIEEETTYNATAMLEAPCLSEANWFPHAQTPAPAEGKGSPFDVSVTTNCIFHQWSWQKFLWVTKPESGLPLFLNQKEIIQVTDAMAPVTQRAGANVVLTSIEQAGTANGILKTNPAYNPEANTQYTVHYSIHTSTIMKQAADKFKADLVSGELKPDNPETFPVGSLELKVSWVDTNAIPANKRQNYYTTMGALSNDGGETFTNTTVALLGVHVVGVVENHPEFIWATFEHNDIAPNYDWKANSATTATEKLLFSKGSTTGLGGITYTKGVGPTTADKAYDLFQYGVPRDSNGILKNTSQSEPANFNHIKEINENVATNLKDVWVNYFYNGSIWLNTDKLTPLEQSALIINLAKEGKTGNAKIGDSIRGSVNNANVTMETFTQTFQSDISKINVNNLANCFSCHNGTSFSGNYSPIYLSHIFDKFILKAKGKSEKEIELMKDKQQEEIAEFLKTL